MIRIAEMVNTGGSFLQVLSPVHRGTIAFFYIRVSESPAGTILFSWGELNINDEEDPGWCREFVEDTIKMDVQFPASVYTIE